MNKSNTFLLGEQEQKVTYSFSYLYKNKFSWLKLRKLNKQTNSKVNFYERSHTVSATLQQGIDKNINQSIKIIPLRQSNSFSFVYISLIWNLHSFITIYLTTQFLAAISSAVGGPY